MDLSNPVPQPESEEAAQYIGALSHELRTMAAKANLGFLAYLLGMVEDEASAVLQKLNQQREGA